MNGQPVVSGSSLNAAFGAGGALNGSAGCNTYSASYSVNGQALLIGQPSATGLLCPEPPGIMEQETAFLNALATTSSFSMEAGQLYLRTGGGTVEFVLQEP